VEKKKGMAFKKIAGIPALPEKRIRVDEYRAILIAHGNRGMRKWTPKYREVGKKKYHDEYQEQQTAFSELLRKFLGELGGKQPNRKFA